MERHFAYQTLGAVSPWIQSCAAKLGVEVSRVAKWLSTVWIIAGSSENGFGASFCLRISGHRIVPSFDWQMYRAELPELDLLVR